MSPLMPGMQPEDMEPGGPGFGAPPPIRVGQTREQRKARIQGLIDNFTFSLGAGLSASAEARGGAKNRTMAGMGAALQAAAFLEQARQAQAKQAQEMQIRQAELQNLLNPKPKPQVPGVDVPFSPEVTANKIAIQHPPAAPKPPEAPKKIDEFVNPSGKRVYAMQQPDGKITYEEGPEVQQPREPNAPRPTEAELDFQDYLKHNELTGKYGPDRIGFDKYKQDQRIEQAKATKTGPDPSIKELRVETRVDNIRSQYNAHPVVKKYNVVQDAVQFAKNLDPKTTNPSDDQALIYAFAKAMDPDSVVREGEYATVQKYSQSWADKFGFDVKRVFSNTTFLTPAARTNMKTTIEARAKPVQQQYGTVRKDFVGRIQQVTGRDGNEYIPDYGGAFDEPKPEKPTGPPANVKWLVGPGGKLIPNPAYKP